MHSRILCPLTYSLFALAVTSPAVGQTDDSVQEGQDIHQEAPNNPANAVDAPTRGEIEPRDRDDVDAPPGNGDAATTTSSTSTTESHDNRPPTTERPDDVAGSAPRAAQPATGTPSPNTEPTSSLPSEKTGVFTPGEVTVQAEKIATIDRAITQTVVTAKDIEAHGDRNLSDTLQLVPGMSTYQHGKGHVRFRMRGFEMPYVALLIDGIPVADVYEANVDISKLPVMNASAIVINRGTSSALYGTNGTIGSINIITTKPYALYAKAQGELGFNGDYLLNAAHGNTWGNYYYWMTGSVERQAPFEISKRLRASKWLTQAMPSNLGYTIDTTNPAATEYLNASEWPHQEMLKYNLSAKAGYAHSKGFETGIAVSFNQSSARRFSISPTMTEEYTQGGWPATDPTMRLGAGAFNWRDVYSVTAAPYGQYRSGRFSIKGNVYYQFTSELLDGYQDSGETVPIQGWGGAHSNWRNTSEGFNILPSYAPFEWNRINGSVLFRWDKHVERVQADPAFVGRGAAAGGADAAFALAGNDWALTKVMAGDQLTVAVEDEVSLSKLASVPVEASLGVSYDAQQLDKYRARSQTMAQGRVTEFGRQMQTQYIAHSDSTLWGTRDSLNPVFGVTYRAVDDLLLFRGSLSRKTRLPTMSQYANVYENTDVGLRPETSVNANVGLQVFLRKHSASVRADYFFSSFRDKLATIYDPATPTVRYYTNVTGENHQGVEVIVDGKAKNVLNVAAIDASVSYTYVRVRNVDTDVQNSLIAKGSRVAEVPEHQVAADLQFAFVSKTSWSIFGNYTANAIRYAMRENPAVGAAFATSYYKQRRLHDPVMLNTKLSQRVFDGCDVYLMVRNILDDYAADPFNPGPGRQFYIGARATY